MNYTVEKTEVNKVKFTITLTAGEWDAANVKAYENGKSNYSLQGFRKGHVPRRVLENVYGKGLFFEEAFNIAVPEYYAQALDKQPEIFPVDSPEIDVVNVDDNGIVFTAIAVIKPEVKLGQYKGLNIEKTVYTVTEEDIAKELKTAQERASRLVIVEGRAAQIGDTAIINYSGSTDGVKFAGGTAENQPLELGSGQFIPGFEEQVVGMQIGEEKDINVKFPENYAPELANKDAVFAIKLNELKVKELPEINDEFAKDVSEFDNLADYKADIEKRLAEANEKRATGEHEDKILDAVSATSEVEIPEVMIENQITQMVKEMEYRLMYQGMKMDDYFKYTGTTVETLRDSYKEQAAKQTKARLVLEAIIKAEKLEATKEEIDAKVAELAKEANKDVEEFAKEMPENRLEYIVNQLVIDKLFALLKA